jgi:integrase
MRHIIKRGKWFHFKRRVPNLYSCYYDNEIIQLSLKTDSETVAVQRASILNSELEKIWSQLTEYDQLEKDNLFEKAVTIARMSGFGYRPAAEIAEQNMEKILSRINSIKDDENNNPEKVHAILGSHDRPEFTLSKILESYFEFEMPNLLNKSDDQIRKWKNPRKKAINNFIAVCGDKEASLITRDDILTFREWWHERIKYEELTANSSNKDFSYLAQILNYARDDKQIDLDVNGLLARVRFTETASSRPPFATDFIQNNLLDLNNLLGLNNECRYFLFAMADTGARPSELVGLNAEKGDIRLDTDIPYIFIRPDIKRELKTPHSKRKIPLTGASLFAFQQLPQGFDHYYRKPDLLSSALNKYLQGHGLLPTKEHCVYSLRHSFEDRLTAVELPDKVQAALMGHKYDRPRYGDGPSLIQKQKWLEKICLDVTQ